jgi:hypothetical protein
MNLLKRYLEHKRLLKKANKMSIQRQYEEIGYKKNFSEGYIEGVKTLKYSNYQDKKQNIKSRKQMIKDFSNPTNHREYEALNHAKGVVAAYGDLAKESHKKGYNVYGFKIKN